MRIKGRKYFVWLLAIIFLLTQVFISPAFSQSTTQVSETITGSKTVSETMTDRIAGADRYQTAAAVSQKGWKTSNYAVLARGDNFADALCAGPLAQKYGGPILLTESNQLNADTLTELKRLGVKHLFIAGGVRAVSQSVEDALKAEGIAIIERLYGTDRYETSVKIAQKIGNTGKAVLATGSDFPDALSISGIAAKLAMPILLSAKDTLPASVSSYFQGSAITQTYVVGGTGVISDNVMSSVPAPTRLGGTDRYETNVAILQNFVGELNYDTLYVAIGTNFADALTGAVLAGKTSSPLVLTANNLPTATANFLLTKLKLSSKVLGLGGSSVVPSEVLTGLVTIKEQIPVEEKYSTAGTYGPETGSKTIKGSVIISAADVTLKNTIIEGDLLLGGSIGDGNVTLRDVTVKGKTIVNGGGPNSIIMYNFNGQTVVVDIPDGGNVRLVAQGTTSLAGVSMESDGTLEETGSSGSGFVNVAIPEGVQVTFIGAFSQVSVEASGASINLPNGSTITTLNLNAASNIIGQGQITTANINTSGVTIEQTPTTTTTIGSGLTAMVGGILVTGTNNAPSGGGGGGGGPVAVAFSGLTANGTSGSVSTTELTLTFDIDPTTLAASDITVTGATKGALTGTGTTRTLAISNITVANGANVTVAITNPAGFTITPSSKDIAVNVNQDNTDLMTAWNALDVVWDDQHDEKIMRPVYGTNTNLLVMARNVVANAIEGVTITLALTDSPARIGADGAITYTGVESHKITVLLNLSKGTGTPISKRLYVVIPAAPTQSGAPAFSAGTPATFGIQMTVGDGSLTTKTNIIYTWYRSANATYESGTDTQRGTGATYSPVAGDTGWYLIVVATSTDAIGSGYIATAAGVAKAAYAGEPATTPTVSGSPTSTQITLTDLGATYEYAITNVGGTVVGSPIWQSSNIFTGLTASTAYKCKTRIKATTTTLASAPSNESAPISTASSLLAIGDPYGGGKVAYILQSGDPGYDANQQHGLIAATQVLNDPDYPWEGIPWVNALPCALGTQTTLGSGSANTAKMITWDDFNGYPNAASIANNYRGGSFSDWYLPSKDELAIMKANSNIPANIPSAQWFWSSSEYDDVRAWALTTIDSIMHWMGEENTFYVWPVRSF